MVREMKNLVGASSTSSFVSLNVNIIHYIFDINFNIKIN